MESKRERGRPKGTIKTIRKTIIIDPGTQELITQLMLTGFFMSEAEIIRRAIFVAYEELKNNEKNRA